MHSNFDLQLQLQPVSETMTESLKEPLVTENITDPALWTGAFNTSILTTRAHSTRDCGQDLSALMKTNEFECLLAAAQQLAVKENLSPDEATERLIHVFRQIDQSWNEIVMARGLKSLTDSN